MTLIGMPEAARQAGTARNTIKRALENAGVPLVKINERAFAVEEHDFAVYLAQRPSNYQGRGRPLGAKNKADKDNT